MHKTILVTVLALCLVACFWIAPTSAQNPNLRALNVTAAGCTPTTFPCNAGFLDQFNRSDGALGANWSTPIVPGHSTFTIVSNGAENGATANASIYWSLATFGPNAEVGAQVADVAHNAVGLEEHLDVNNPNTGSRNGYTLYIASTTTLQFYKAVANSESQICLPDITLGTAIDSTNNSIAFTKNGTTLTAWQLISGTWTSVGTCTDATFNSVGYVGIASYVASKRIDDFRGGTR